MQRTHVRTRVGAQRRVRRAISHAGRGRAFLLAPYVWIPAAARTNVANFFFFSLLLPGFFSRLRDHVIRASRAKFPLAVAFADFVFLGDVFFC